MSRYVKGLADITKLTNSLIDVRDEARLQRKVSKKLAKEVTKLNEVAGNAQENKIKNLETELKALKAQTKWVDNTESAAKLTPEHLLKKLDIL